MITYFPRAQCTLPWPVLLSQSGVGMCEPVESVDIRVELRLNIRRVQEPTLNVSYIVCMRKVSSTYTLSYGTGCSHLSSIDCLSKGWSMDMKGYTSTWTYMYT